MGYLIPGSLGSMSYRAPDGQEMNPATGRVEAYHLIDGQKIFASDQQAQADAIAAAHQGDRYRGALGWASHYVAPAVKAGVLGVVAGGAGYGTLAGLGASGSGAASAATGSASGGSGAVAGGGMSWLSAIGAPLVQGVFGAYGSHQQQKATDRSALLAKQAADEQLAYAKQRDAEDAARYKEKLDYDRAQAAKAQSEAKAAWDAQEGRLAPGRQASEGMMAKLAQKYGLPYTPSQTPSSGPPPGWTPGQPTSTTQPEPSLASMVPAPMPQDTGSLASMTPDEAPAPVAEPLPEWLTRRQIPQADTSALNTLTRYGRRA